MDISALMAEFARDIDMPVHFSPGDQLSLQLGDGIVVDVEHDVNFDTLYLKTAVGTLPPDAEARNTLLLRLLVANGFDPVTQYASIACEEDERTLILVAKLAVADTSSAALMDRLEQLAANAGPTADAIATASAHAISGVNAVPPLLTAPQADLSMLVHQV